MSINETREKFRAALQNSNVNESHKMSFTQKVLIGIVVIFIGSCCYKHIKVLNFRNVPEEKTKRQMVIEDEEDTDPLFQKF